MMVYASLGLVVRHRDDGDEERCLCGAPLRSSHSEVGVHRPLERDGAHHLSIAVYF